MESQKIAEKIFGINNLWETQKKAIKSILSGKNTLCLMPTGGGKSLIFQVAGLQLQKTTIIISPLLALMNSMNTKLNMIDGISSVAINSDNLNLVKQQFEFIKEMSKKKLPNFIFLSPEKATLDGFLEFSLQTNKEQIGLITIDEVHCVSQWGHDFRPSYKLIPHFIENIFNIHKPPVLCLTATLSPKDTEEVVSDFNIDEIVKSPSMHRTNIDIKILSKIENNNDKRDELEKILRRKLNDKIIVYTHIRNPQKEYSTKQLSDYFKKKGFNCAYFDSGVERKKKNEVLNDFETGQTKIIFATSAFGMGMDIPDIRVCIHYLIPESIEQYYQEIGRIGRDGKVSFAYLLFTETNIKVKNFLIKQSYPKKGEIEKILKENILRKSKNRYKKIYTSDEFGDTFALIFNYLLEKNIVRIVKKSIAKLDCFSPNTIDVKIKEYFEKSGRHKALSRLVNANYDINEITDNVFYSYASNKIELLSSPEKVMYYIVNNKYSDELVTKITEEFEEKKNSRMENFKILADMIKTQDNPTEIITQYLGIK